MAIELSLQPEQLEALRLAARSSRYHLLLGAGASFGSVSHDNRPLPGGAALANEIGSAFQVSNEEGDLLWRVYDRAVAKHGQAPVYDWLRRRFYNVKPPVWMQKYARFPWERVWTLNIDDAFQTSYATVANSASRTLETASWNSPASPDRNLAVVHLHGHVHDSQPSELVFSLAEYYQAAVSGATWPFIFRDQYGVKPFVVIGARLRDEPDLEAVIRRRPEHDAPSFYVSPDISPGLAEDLKSWRLIPVRATAEEFTKIWAKLTNMNLEETPSRPEEYALRLARQFRELKIDVPGKEPLKHDLLGGDEPRWTDVATTGAPPVPATTTWTATAGGRIGQLLGKEASSCLIFVGDRLSGRSTGMFQIARSFALASRRVFLFTADELPDSEAILQFASDGKALLLVFDGVADFAVNVGKIVGDARAAGLSVSCLAVDLTENRDNILGRIPVSLLAGDRIYTIPRRLEKPDATALVQRLYDAGRLGKIEGWYNEKGGFQRLVRYFLHQEIFSQMAGLEEAPGFGRRVGKAVDDLKSDEDVQIAFFASMAARVDRRITVVELGRMSGLPPEEVLRRMSGSTPLGALFGADGEHVQSRQRWLALEPLIHRLKPAASLLILAAGIRKLKPSISQRGNRQRNTADTLVGSLMSHKHLSSIFPGQPLERWYKSLLPTFGDWSGRFWEQRAIANREASTQDPGASARAESFARRAVSITDDTYSNTTLGTVLMARAAEFMAFDIPLGLKYYANGFEAFEHAQIRDPANIITWWALLRYSLRVIEQLNAHSEDVPLEERRRVEDDWKSTHDSLKTVLAASPEALRDLEKLKSRYVELSSGEAVEQVSNKPVVKGRPVVGSTLRAHVASKGDGYQVIHAWRRNSDRIEESGQSAEYRVKPEDIGARLSVTVTWKKLGYGPESKTSSETEPITS
ncbi:SIR2 family protein [Arthrobacter sp. NPDC097144]|uniref:SIR2 family protein n=1 Tax=Arthrobacter sp. NPDC097144 TaxID=3363946 RepID=UPI0037F2AC10